MFICAMWNPSRFIAGTDMFYAAFKKYPALTPSLSDGLFNCCCASNSCSLLVFGRAQADCSNIKAQVGAGSKANENFIFNMDVYHGFRG